MSSSEELVGCPPLIRPELLPVVGDVISVPVHVVTAAVSPNMPSATPAAGKSSCLGGLVSSFWHWSSQATRSMYRKLTCDWWSSSSCQVTGEVPGDAGPSPVISPRTKFHRYKGRSVPFLRFSDNTKDSSVAVLSNGAKDSSVAMDMKSPDPTSSGPQPIRVPGVPPVCVPGVEV